MRNRAALHQDVLRHIRSRLKRDDHWSKQARGRDLRRCVRPHSLGPVRFQRFDAELVPRADAIGDFQSGKIERAFDGGIIGTEIVEGLIAGIHKAINGIAGIATKGESGNGCNH